MKEKQKNGAEKYYHWETIPSPHPQIGQTQEEALIAFHNYQINEAYALGQKSLRNKMPRSLEKVFIRANARVAAGKQNLTDNVKQAISEAYSIGKAEIDWSKVAGIRKELYASIFKELTGKKATEILANLEHEQWSHWEEYRAIRLNSLQSLDMKLANDQLINWKRLREQPYSQLTEKEKESDREWARKVQQKIIGILEE